MRGLGIVIFILGGFLILFLGEESLLLADEEIAIENQGEIFGTITFKGTPPEIEPHEVLRNPEFCGTTVKDETYLVNSVNKGLKNAVVSIEGIDFGKKRGATTLILENRDCYFNPHVFTAVVGDSYEVRNADPILHNTHLTQNGARLLNIVMPPNGRNIKKTLTERGIIKVKCDAHTFMTAWLLVMNNLYFAITDKDGAYKITDIPPGKYQLKIWHEGLSAKKKRGRYFS